MTIETLVSTMNLKNKEEHEKLIKNMNIKGKSITINQITKNDIEIFSSIEGKNRVISFKEKGLSKSRNKAIKNSIADICVIADDDMLYYDNYENIILSAYDKYKEADIIAFCVDTSNKERPLHRLNEGKLGFKDTLKLVSVQITFRRESFLKNNLKFNELFGAGAKYNCGEENILLADACRLGMNIYFVSETIGSVSNETSTWWDGVFDEKYFNTKGACYYMIDKDNFLEIATDFANRKYDLYKANYSKEQVISFMINGKNELED